MSGIQENFFEKIEYVLPDSFRAILALDPRRHALEPHIFDSTSKKIQKSGLIDTNCTQEKRIGVQNIKDWVITKQEFMDKFFGKDSEIKAWHELQEISLANFQDVEEFKIKLISLFSKAKIKESTVKWRCFMGAIDPKYQRLILREKISDFDKVLEVLCDKAELYKLIDSHQFYPLKPSSVIPSETDLLEKRIVKSHGKENDNMYEALIAKFKSFLLICFLR
ncbi:hypothetical protein BB559_003071 [Furculomyces boomerangus]|uniref:Retrotransposon gag domain-containing protein n=1 Tax=Furculomyces boomerangus TaxID=61424 RepID=A0A2T9YPC2_9FUNG|nr:hypothetical protein BB559_003071 [Furculomyces boomerangus]